MWDCHLTHLDTSAFVLSSELLTSTCVWLRACIKEHLTAEMHYGENVFLMHSVNKNLKEQSNQEPGDTDFSSYPGCILCIQVVVV